MRNRQGSTDIAWGGGKCWMILRRCVLKPKLTCCRPALLHPALHQPHALVSRFTPARSTSSGYFVADAHSKQVRTRSNRFALARTVLTAAHLSGVVHDREFALVLELLRLLELLVVAKLLDNLFDEGLVGGLREPALLVQEGQDSRGV